MHQSGASRVLPGVAPSEGNSSLVLALYTGIFHDFRFRFRLGIAWQLRSKWRSTSI